MTNLEDELLSTQTNKPEQTIVAPASALVSQAVGVVRISGSDAWSIANSFTEYEKLPAPGSFSYCRIIDPFNGELIDCGLILAFKSPKSFTGEDCIEIQVHGSPTTLQRITKCAIALGARQANPGEFSYRAFINGKQSIAQLELGNAISHLANTQSAHGISRAVKSIRDQLSSIIVNLEAQISYPNDVPTVNIDAQLTKLSSMVKSVLDSSSKPGYPTVVIAGPPNAGKSTLFNRLIGFDRTVVSSQSGTTRDFVKVETNIDDKVLELIDGPGLDMDSPDSGQALVRQIMNTADVILWLDPNAQSVTETNRMILIQSISDQFHTVNNDWLQLSVKRETGLTDVTQAIASHLKDRHYAVTGRQYDVLKEINKRIDTALIADNPDMISYDLTDAMKLVSQLDGVNLSTKMIKEIFSTFCIGK